MNNDELKNQIAALKARRKPPLTEDERKVKEEHDRLMAELAIEQAAVRAEENEAIKTKFAPDKSRAFFDFDPDCVHPAFVEYQGQQCRLHSRFVVRAAHDDDMAVFDDVAEEMAKAKLAGKVIDKATEKRLSNTTARMARSCLVYPTADVYGRSSAEHVLDLDASLWYFGGATMTLGNKAGELGGLHLLAHQSKS